MESITVVIASYKYGHLAAAAIESVLDQDRVADEILFVDDGGRDCGRLPRLYPEVRFRLRRRNLGTVANFNDALSHVTTDRVMFLGADNMLHHEALSLMGAVDADIVGCYVEVIGDRHDQYPHHDKTSRIWKARDPHGSALYRVEKAIAAGGYRGPEGCRHTAEDNKLFSKMRQQRATVSCVERPLLLYRRHRANHNKP